jgi:hypothetical protein
MGGRKGRGITRGQTNKEGGKVICEKGQREVKIHKENSK